MQDNPILITGFPRSGTSWLADIVLLTKQFQYMYEPFQPSFACPQVVELLVESLPRPEGSTELRSFYYKVFSDEYRNQFSDQCRIPGGGPRILVKDVCSNLHIRFLLSEFPNLKIIHIIRDIESVLGSIKRLSWFEAILRNRSPRNKGATDYAQVVDQWSYENTSAIEQGREFPDRFLIIRYRSMIVGNQMDGLRAIYKFIQCQYPTISMEDLLKPSISTHEGVIKKSNLLKGWKEILTPQEINTALMVYKNYQS